MIDTLYTITFQSPGGGERVKIVKIEGIGYAHMKKLQFAGVKAVAKLLKRGATPAGRDQLAGEAGISGSLILVWVNHADF